MSKVSVIIPVFNVEKYIKIAIDSILNQTYKNIEIIIVDDGSCDKTFDCVLEMASVDSRIVAIKNNENKKISYTLNRGLSFATGDYIARMDGDDISDIDRIRVFVDFLEKNSACDLVGCSVNSIDKDGNILGVSTYYSSQDKILKTLKYRSPVAHIWMARRSLYELLDGYRDMPGVEDYDFILRAISSGKMVSNMENYIGYSVRIFRDGNTASVSGLRQRRQHCYAYNLYKERVKYGCDSYSKDDFSKKTSVSELYSKVHNFSNKMFGLSVISWRSRNFSKMIFFGVASLVSPAQIAYIYSRIIFRWKSIW